MDNIFICWYHCKTLPLGRAHGCTVVVGCRARVVGSEAALSQAGPGGWGDGGEAPEV